MWWKCSYINTSTIAKRKLRLVIFRQTNSYLFERWECITQKSEFVSSLLTICNDQVFSDLRHVIKQLDISYLIVESVISVLRYRNIYFCGITSQWPCVLPPTLSIRPTSFKNAMCFLIVLSEIPSLSASSLIVSRGFKAIASYVLRTDSEISLGILWESFGKSDVPLSPFKYSSDVLKVTHISSVCTLYSGSGMPCMEHDLHILSMPRPQLSTCPER